MISSEIEDLNAAWFADMSSLEILHIERNNLRRLPSGVFNSLVNLRDVYVYQNHLNEINDEAFATPSRLRTFNAQNNQINSILPAFFDNSLELNSLYLGGNLCNNNNFWNVQGTRDAVRTALQPCFNNSAVPSIINCDFISTGGMAYTCELSLDNPLRRDDFERVEGEHLNGNTDVDVLRVEGIDQNSLIVPRILCIQFENLEEMFFEDSGIEFITTHAFEHCVNLRSLTLEHNSITTIPNMAFSHSRSLEFLDLNNNHISSISPNAFLNTRLWYLNLETNQLTNLSADWFSSVRETLLLLDVANNRITHLQDNVFAELVNLIEMEIGFNSFG